MLVQWSIAQFVEHGARPPALDEADGVQAVGDQRDPVGFESDELFLQPFCAARGFDCSGQLRQRDDMTADIASCDEPAQERAGIVRRYGNLRIVAGRRTGVWV